MDRDTILTVDDTMTEEEVMETLKAHKQIIANVKTQTWPMHRKLKVRALFSLVLVSEADCFL